MLYRKCGKAAKREIQGNTLAELREETAGQRGDRAVLVVDAMNLLFHLAGLENGPGVEEGLRTFCLLLQEQGVQAACVFDSNKMSKQRKLLSNDRRRQRTEAIKELEVIRNKHGTELPEHVRRKHTVLRSRTIHVGPKEVRAAWDQLSKSGVCTVLMAQDDADSVCVDMVERGVAFACLSNDSDMFVRGCSVVLRQYDPVCGCFELWNTSAIYASLGMTPERFVAVCEAANQAKHTHTELYEAMVAEGAAVETKMS